MTKAAQAKAWTLNEWADGTTRSLAEPASGLQAAIAGLTAGQDAAYAAAEPSLMSSGDYDWQHEFHRDADRKLLHVLGQQHTQTSFEHIVFNETTEGWSQVGSSLFALADDPSNYGHVYGNSAFDPDTGDLYFWHEIGFIRRYTQATGSWDFTTASNALFGSTQADRKNGMVWHRDLFGVPGDGGLVCFHRNNGLWAWRKLTDTWHEIGSDIGVGCGYGIGVYDSVNGVSYIGGGTSGSETGKLWRIASGTTPTATDLGTFPILPSSTFGTDGSGLGWLMILGGKLYNMGKSSSGVVHTSTDQGATWDEELFTHPFGGTSWILSPVDAGICSIHFEQCHTWKPDS